MRIYDIRLYMVSCILLASCLYLLGTIFATLYVRCFKKEKNLCFSQNLQAREIKRIRINLCISILGLILCPLIFYLLLNRNISDYTYLMQEEHGQYALEVFISNIPLYLILVIDFLFSLLKIIEYFLREQLSGNYLFLKTGMVRIKDITSIMVSEDKLLIKVNRTLFNSFFHLSPEGKHRKTFEVTIITETPEIILQRLHQKSKIFPQYELN